MKELFQVLILSPFEIFLFTLFVLIKDFGLAILLFSVILRLLLLPISLLQLIEENKLKKIKKRLDEETKNTKDLIKKAELINNIYKEEKFNPFKNIFFQLLVIPVYLGAVVSILNILKKISNPYFINLMNLAKPNIPLGVIVIALNFYYAFKQPPESRKILFFILGLISIIILTIPSALLLYFLVNLLFVFLERKIFERYLVKPVIQSIKIDNP